MHSGSSSSTVGIQIQMPDQISKKSMNAWLSFTTSVSTEIDVWLSHLRTGTRQIRRPFAFRVKLLNSLDGSRTTRAIPNPGSLQRNRASVAIGKPSFFLIVWRYGTYSWLERSSCWGSCIREKKRLARQSTQSTYWMILPSIAGSWSVTKFPLWSPQSTPTSATSSTSRIQIYMQSV